MLVQTLRRQCPAQMSNSYSWWNKESIKLRSIVIFARGNDCISLYHDAYYSTLPNGTSVSLCHARVCLWTLEIDAASQTLRTITTLFVAELFIKVQYKHFAPSKNLVAILSKCNCVVILFCLFNNKWPNKQLALQRNVICCLIENHPFAFEIVIRQHEFGSCCNAV